MKKRTVVTMAIAIAAVPMIQLGVPTLSHAAAPSEEQVSFQEDVLHIFKRHCVPCHEQDGAGYKESGLLLMTYRGVMRGTKFGPMVLPGDPEASNLLRLIDWRASPQLRMPHGGKQLSVCDRDAIRIWIRQGAKDN